jgi:hypothetical protein
MKTTNLIGVKIEDRPGTLAKVSRCLAAGKVNIEAVNVWGGQAWFRVKDQKHASDVLTAGGFRSETGTYFEVPLPNQPGRLASISEALGKAGVNIQAAFGSASGTGTATLYLRVDNPEKAAPLIEGAVASTPGAQH